MLKKDREKIAKVIKYYLSDPDGRYEGTDYIEGIAKDIADYITIDNPCFNRVDFIKLCGVGEG